MTGPEAEEAGEAPAQEGWPQVALSLEDPSWEALPDPEALIAKAAAAAFEIAELSPEGWAVSVLLASDDAVARLNIDHRGKTGPTNVLSWPAYDLAAQEDGCRPVPPPEPDLMEGEEAEEIGDLALAFGVCEDEALSAGAPFSDHVTHLVLHGVLHCLGYDHISDRDAALMEGLESRAMEAMGLADPYRADG